jgi:hypothetical protein
MKRMIVCAAIRDLTGNIICGPRHFDSVMHNQLAKMTSYTAPFEQGFVDQRGEFLTRHEAWVVAVESGQIIRRVGGDESKLFSENLY